MGLNKRFYGVNIVMIFLKKIFLRLSFGNKRNLRTLAKQFRSHDVNQARDYYSRVYIPFSSPEPFFLTRSLVETKALGLMAKKRYLIG